MLCPFVSSKSFVNHCLCSLSEKEAIYSFFQEIKWYQKTQTQTLPGIVILTATLLEQRHNVLCALANYYKAVCQVCSYLFASLVLRFHLMVEGHEFSESPVN